MKKKNKLIINIQNKRATYLKGIIDDFIGLDKQNETLQNCFSFVNNKFNKEDFIKLLNEEEKDLITDNIDNWFSSLTLIDLFYGFISNIEYQNKLNK